MKIFYIILFTGFIHADSDITFVSPDKQCLDQTDFCICEDIWVICDCQNGNKTTGNLFHDKRHIIIKNCQQLLVTQGSFKPRPQIVVVFKDIQNLSLANGSFEIGSNKALNITISNSNSQEVPSGLFSESHQGVREPVGVTTLTHSLVFQVVNSKIGRIARGAFTNCTFHQLIITNTTIGHIDTRAINNRVQQTINFINNTFVSLDRRAVILHSSSKNTELRLNRNKFKGNVPQFLVGNIKGDVYISSNNFPELKISPWQLRVDGEVLLQGNTFAYLPRHGLDFTVRHRISLVDNDIQHLGPEAFLLIVPQGKKTIIFMDGNLIHHLEPMSLCLHEEFSANSVVIKHVRIQHKCECNITHALDVKNLTLKAIYNNEVHKQWFNNGECMLKSQGISHISIDQFLFHSCPPRNKSIMVILIVLASILIAMALCVILGWRRMRSTAPNVSSSAAGYQSYTEPCPPNTVPGSWLVVQPECRTYQETEIHVVFDKAQEIADDDDTETNKDVRDNNKIKDIKRTPSPSSRQSCPILPMSKS